MASHVPERTRWAIVMAFAIAMAWVEAASVFYIRTVVDRIEPYQANPLPIHGALGNVELWREAATLVMLATVGMLAGRTWRLGDCLGPAVYERDGADLAARGLYLDMPAWGTHVFDVAAI